VTHIKSLRWRLQVWHALILLLVITGFGSLFYAEVRRARLDEIDAELLSGARVLEGVLRTMPPYRRPPPGSQQQPPPPRRLEFSDRLAPGQIEPGPPPRGRPPRGPDPPGRRPLPDRLARVLDPEIFSLPNSRPTHDGEDVESPYFVVRSSSGEVIRANPPDTANSVPIDPSVGRSYESHARNRGDLRELTLLGPSGTNILVGRSIRHELDGLRRLGWQLMLSGLGVFTAGLLGGWWLSSHAVRPVVDMGQTISQINASNLTRRLDLTDVDTELAGLGLVVNQMLDRLENAFQQQTRFTADASHELRTPLAVIMSQVELALARPREGAAYRESLEACGRAAVRMKTLVENLLTLARVDADKLDLKQERVDLNRLAAENAAMLLPLACERGVTICVETSGSPVTIQGDPGRLTQVIMNVLNNAILYNKPGGEARVVTRLENEQAILTVFDTGIGIPSADLPHLFERFHRVDSARSRSTGGSGLGLAICRGIVEAHGGVISATSTLGQGSEFVVRIPVTVT